MTNHWADIDNTSLVFAIGCNPVENHPACMAHVNAARFDNPRYWDGTNYHAKRGATARLVVVDPRKTRTALQADLYVRIRPGTDVAFINGILNYIMTGIENATIDSTFKSNFIAWHNSTSANHYSVGRVWFDDANRSVTLTKDVLATAAYDGVAATGFSNRGWPKYCDSRVKVDTSGTFTDYKRAPLTVTEGGATRTFSNAPVLLSSILDAETVYMRLKAHVANYTLAVAADICGCQPNEIIAVAEELIANSRMKSSDFDDALAKPWASGYKATTLLYAMGATQHTNGSQMIRDYAVLQTMLGNMGRPGGGINALRGIHNVQGSTDMGVLFDAIPGYSGNPGTTGYPAYSNALFGNRVVNGAVTTGAGSPYDYKKLGIQQRGFYNMTTQWFGAPGGADTVASAAVPAFAPGSLTLANLLVDAGSVHVYNMSDVEYPEAAYTVALATGVITRVAGGTIPYNASVKVDYTHHSGTAVTGETKTFSQTTVSLTVGVAPYNGLVLKNGAEDVTYTAGTDYSYVAATGVITKLSGVNINDAELCKATYTAAGGWRTPADFERLYALWPKGNGVDHITAFRQMGGSTPTIKAAVIWGQNPAISEPNQSAVRAGLENLDLMVCVDTYETETTSCHRKSNGITYLLPACSYVEEAGSVSSSGRMLQWRDRAVAPKGNSKADLELLFRLAKAIDAADGFKHITDKWAEMGTPVAGSTVRAWTVLWGKHCTGWDGVGGTVVPNDADPAANSFEGLTFDDEDRGYGEVFGSEAVCESVFKEICMPMDDVTAGYGGGGCMWIYSGNAPVGGYCTTKAETTVNAGFLIPKASVPDWGTINRAKSRNSDFAGECLTYPRYGWAWLFNRRVFYNNSEVGNDVGDVFVAPGNLSRLMTLRKNNTNTLADWSNAYRAYNTVNDLPSKTGGPHALGIPGNFPAHTEPIETPRRDLAASYGRNTTMGSGSMVSLVKDDTPVAMWSSDPAESGYADALYTGAGSWSVDADEFPLVLTTIRCVEHFQGGPTTRNNSWNVEAEPIPWVEINSMDAFKLDIHDGDMVEITTARGGSRAAQKAWNAGVHTADANWAKGFIARVGSGPQTNQRVGKGVVAIPWHWGEVGLGTGSRANDLCIDAGDANTVIPEYKACLCKIAKI